MANRFHVRLTMKKIAFIFLFGVLLSLHAFAVEYAKVKIRATVVDAETNEPLEWVTVVVIRQWLPVAQKEERNKPGPITLNDTITDNAGKFSFNLGSVEISDDDLVWRRDLRKASLKLYPPEIMLFKPGYEFQKLRNADVSERTRDETLSPNFSEWDGKTIKMKKFKGGASEYAKHLAGFGSDLRRMAEVAYSLDIVPKKCLYGELGPVIYSLRKQTKIFEAENIHPSPFEEFLELHDKYYLEYGCDSPKMYLRK